MSGYDPAFYGMRRSPVFNWTVDGCSKVIDDLKAARALHVGRPCRHAEDAAMLEKIDAAIAALSKLRGDSES